MKQEFFDKVLERRLELIKKVLANKRAEYTVGDDRVHNFHRAAEMLRTTRSKALVGMWAKHLVSILDIVDGVSIGSIPSIEMIEEKIGDTVNYAILLEAMLKEYHEEAL